jgi:hypothetical protein
VPPTPCHFSLLLKPQLADSLVAPLRSSCEFLCKPGCLCEGFFNPFYNRCDLSRFEITRSEILDERPVLSTGLDDTVRLWDLKTGGEIRRFEVTRTPDDSLAIRTRRKMRPFLQMVD